MTLASLGNWTPGGGRVHGTVLNTDSDRSGDAIVCFFATAAKGTVPAGAPAEALRQTLVHFDRFASIPPRARADRAVPTRTDGTALPRAAGAGAARGEVSDPPTTGKVSDPPTTEVSDPPTTGKVSEPPPTSTPPTMGASIDFELTPSHLTMRDAKGSPVFYPGAYELTLSLGGGPGQQLTLPFSCTAAGCHCARGGTQRGP